MSPQMFMRMAFKVMLGLALALATLHAVPCNDQYAVPVSSARCFEGCWCSWWDCRYCAECINHCACDENILCLCNSQWLHLNSCWDQTCDSGGIGSLGVRKHDVIRCSSSTFTRSQSDGILKEEVSR